MATDLHQWLASTHRHYQPLAPNLSRKLLEAILAADPDSEPMVRKILDSNYNQLFSVYPSGTLGKLYLKFITPKTTFKIGSGLKIETDQEQILYPKTSVLKVSIMEHGKRVGHIMVPVPLTAQVQTINLTSNKQHRVTVRLEHHCCSTSGLIGDKTDYQTLLQQLVEPDQPIPEEIAWMLQRFAAYYKLKTAPQTYLQYLLQKDSRSNQSEFRESLTRAYFENILAALQPIQDYTGLQSLKVTLHGYLTRYELLGPWESGAINVMLRLIQLIVPNPIQFIGDAIQQGIQFNYHRFTLNEEEDMIPSDASACATLSKAVENIIQSITTTFKVYAVEFKPLVDIGKVVAVYYYEMLAADVIAKFSLCLDAESKSCIKSGQNQRFQKELCLCNEIFDLYANLEQLHCLLGAQGLTSMSVLPLHQIFKPYLLRYVVSIEAQLQEWSPDYIQKEIEINNYKSSVSMFKSLSHAMRTLDRFKFSADHFVDEYVAFLAMAGRVIVDYLHQLATIPHDPIILSNMMMVREQFPVFMNTIRCQDPSISQLGAIIDTKINTAWHHIQTQISQRICHTLNFNDFIAEFESSLSLWSTLLDPKSLLSLIETAFTQIIVQLEILLLPVMDAKASSKTRPNLIQPIQHFVTQLVQLVQADGDGLSDSQIQERCARLQETWTLYNAPNIILADRYHHREPSLLTKPELESILITRLHKRKKVRQYLRRHKS